MNTELRLATEEHLDQILPLVGAHHEFEGLNTTDSERESSVRMLLSNRSPGDIWLIYCSGELVGYAALCLGYSIEFGGHEATVDEFYVRPEIRGKDLGTNALELLKTEAKSIGVRVLHLEVARTNMKARKLYFRAQFEAREKYVSMSVRL